MEAKFKSLTIFEFQSKFTNDDDCLKYLANIKWNRGFKCKKCSHSNYCKGNGKYTRQCTRCNYNESPTCDTLFHKTKFSMLKAFYIVYNVSTNKKGITSTELSRKLGLRQKTCWLFKQKVMRAMRSSGKHLMVGKVEVDETVVGGKKKIQEGEKTTRKNW